MYTNLSGVCRLHYSPMRYFSYDCIVPIIILNCIPCVMKYEKHLVPSAKTWDRVTRTFDIAQSYISQWINQNNNLF